MHPNALAYPDFRSLELPRSSKSSYAPQISISANMYVGASSKPTCVRRPEARTLYKLWIICSLMSANDMFSQVQVSHMNLEIRSISVPQFGHQFFRIYVHNTDVLMNVATESVEVEYASSSLLTSGSLCGAGTAFFSLQQSG